MVYQIVRDAFGGGGVRVGVDHLLDRETLGAGGVFIRRDVRQKSQQIVGVDNILAL